MNTNPNPNTPSLQQMQAHFQELLPTIQRHAQIYFRHVPSPQQREEYLQETIALAWKWYRRCREMGKDPATFKMTFAILAARAVRSGRRLCCGQSSTDVLSAIAQQRHGFTVESLPISTRRPYEDYLAAVEGQRLMDAYEERLNDNSLTPVPDQVAFRLDFPAWLLTRTDRDRRIIEMMALNHRTLDIADKFGMTPGRVSQLRREYHDDWERFTNVPEQDA